MSPEVLAAALNLVVAFFGMGVAIFVFAPPLIKKQWEIRQKAQENSLLQKQKEQDDKLEAERQAREEAISNARDERAAAAEQRQQHQRLIDSLMAERANDREQRASDRQQSEVMVRALTSSVSVLDGMSKELRANTTVTTDNSRTIMDFVERFDEFLENGAKPFKKLNDKVDAMAVGVATIVLSQKDTTDKVNAIYEDINAINGLMNTLEIMKIVAQAKLEDVRKGTGEHSKIDPVPNSSA